jgi:selenocysteine lyase/cysteine desulfurase
MMYVRSDLAQSLTPTISGWFAQADPFAFDVKKLELSPTARRFEAGTPAIPNLYAAKQGIRLLQSIGLREVAEHIERLAAALLGGVREMHMELKTPLDSVGPLVVLKCKDSAELVRSLADQQIIVSNRRDGLRIALHVYNTIQDVHAVLKALERHLDLLVLESTATKAV